MKLEADAQIPFPREVVFSAYRDRLTELVPHLPNVAAIAVESREETNGRTKFVNKWTAKADVPTVLKGIISADAISWIDRAEWDSDAWTCAWETEPSVFTNNVKCGGVNTFYEENGKTRLEIRGELQVDPKGIPGVPNFLASRVAPAAEKFIVNLIRPNLISVAGGLDSFLKSDQS